MPSAFDGKPITFEQKIYIPPQQADGDYVTTLSDPQGRPVVSDLISRNFRCDSSRSSPTGSWTPGSIMTNDGELGNAFILHPSFEVNKAYGPGAGVHTADQLTLLAQGIEIDGVRTRPAADPGAAAGTKRWWKLSSTRAKRGRCGKCFRPSTTGSCT